MYKVQSINPPGKKSKKLFLRSRLGFINFSTKDRLHFWQNKQAYLALPRLPKGLHPQRWKSKQHRTEGPVNRARCRFPDPFNHRIPVRYERSYRLSGSSSHPSIGTRFLEAQTAAGGESKAIRACIFHLRGSKGFKRDTGDGSELLRRKGCTHWWLLLFFCLTETVTRGCSFA